ncbi:MAG TPA: DpnD/PcfM family protein [Ignavibacteriaceae bacterium]|nr:DpnD/PcfM family protein [Ignavibacteriaceae bacterium]
MKTFKIEIQEFLARVVEVQAESLPQAFSKVNELYKKAEIVLDYDDFVEADFIDINRQSKKDEMKLLINEVIDYLYKDEKRHYEESEEPDNHIFIRLEKLKALNV